MNLIEDIVRSPLKLNLNLFTLGYMLKTRLNKREFHYEYTTGHPM